MCEGDKLDAIAKVPSVCVAGSWMHAIIVIHLDIAFAIGVLDVTPEGECLFSKYMSTLCK